VFERSITTTAQRGVYLVYLFRGDGAAVYLSLNQGTTEIYDRVGGSQYRQVLANRAAVDTGLLRPQGIDDLQLGLLDLPGEGHLTRGYNAGNICARRYDRAAIPRDSVLLSDLHRFLDLYGILIEAREAINESTGEELPEGVEPGEEAQRYRWHRRAERNPRLARDAKRYHGTTCTVCKFNFGERYGRHGAGYIEAHHLTPVAELVRQPGKIVLDPRPTSPSSVPIAIECCTIGRRRHPWPSCAPAFGRADPSDEHEFPFPLRNRSRPTGYPQELGLLGTDLRFLQMLRKLPSPHTEYQKQLGCEDGATLRQRHAVQRHTHHSPHIMESG
jgi:MrcB-like, N-terminal domain